MLQKEYLKSRPNILLKLLELYPNELSPQLDNLIYNHNLDIDILCDEKFHTISKGLEWMDKSINEYKNKMRGEFCRKISSRPDFDDSRIKKYIDENLDWYSLSFYSRNLSIETIDRYSDKFKIWTNLCMRSDKTESFVEKHIDKFTDWNYGCYQHNISIEFLSKHIRNKWNILLHRDINFEYIEKYKDQFNIDRTSYDIIFHFSKKYSPIIDYNLVIVMRSRNLELVESILKLDKVLYWEGLSFNQYLMPILAEKYKDKPIMWDIASSHVGLDFVKKHPELPFNYNKVVRNNLKQIDESFLVSIIDKKLKEEDYYLLDEIKTVPLSLDFLLKNQENFSRFYFWSIPVVFEYIENLTKDTSKPYWPFFETMPDIKEELYDIDWPYICNNPALNIEFVKKNKDKIDWNAISRNKFLYDPLFYRQSILKDIERRRYCIDITLTNDVKNYILKYYIGYD